MSNNRLILNLDVLRQELRNLPIELRDEGGGMVRRNADEAGAEIIAGYPEVSGNLKRGVKVKHESSAFGTVSTVRSNAKHAYLYEYGSQTRQTSLGTPNPMPAAPPERRAIPKIQRNRREMYEELMGLLRDKGLQVTGSA